MPEASTLPSPQTRSAILPAAAIAAQPIWRRVVEMLLIFGVFFLHGAWPVPDVNEAHYLSKAKHYWNPEWCRNDFFVSTADAHQVFDWSFGWITRLMPLVAVAWFGRVLTWALLAIAWQRLSWVIVPRNWWAILTAVLFVSLNENAHMAGEWVIGGVEAKGFAYVLMLFAFEAVVRGRWNWAWLLLGAATGLHVIVGGWSAVAAGVAWLADGRGRAPLKSMLPGLFVGLLLALPGVWFGLALTHGIAAQTVADANAIYVWQRLPHHLSADKFQIGFSSRHFLLWTIWLILITLAPTDAGQRRLRWIVNTAMFLVGIGYVLVLVGHWNLDLAASLLRYYWFRMSDVFIPLGVSLVGFSWLQQALASPDVTAEQPRIRPRAARLWLAALILVAAGDLAMQLSHLPPELACCGLTPVTPRSDKEIVYDDWRDVCRWAAGNTDANAVFLTPRMSETFRWYADRGEVVTWKDIPQDATGIMEWWHRLQDIWGVGTPAGTIASLELLPPQKLADLATKYHAEYAIVQLMPGVARLPQKPVYANNSYAVYRFSGAAEQPSKEPRTK